MWSCKGKVEGSKQVEIGSGDKKTTKIILQVRSKGNGSVFAKDYFIDCFGFKEGDFKPGSDVVLDGIVLKVNKSKETGQVFLNASYYKPREGK